MSRSTSFRTSLIRDLALLVLVFGAAILLLSWMGARRAVGKLSASLVSQTLSTVRSELDDVFDEVRHELEFFASEIAAESPDAAGDLVGRRPERERRLVDLVARSPLVSSVIVATADGQEHMTLSTLDGLRTRLTGVDGPGRVRWYERSGDGLESERTEATDYDPRTRPWFHVAMAAPAGEIHWTNPYRFFTTGDPGITASMRLEGGDGPDRIVAMDVTLREISEYTRTFDLGASGLVTLLTTDGRILGLPGLPRFEDASARASAWLQTAQVLAIPVVDDARAAFAEAEGRAPDEAGAPRGLPASIVERGEATTLRFPSRGEAWWAGIEPYPLADDRQLLVAILLPERELLADLGDLRTALFALIGLVLLAGVIRALVLARRVSSPIESIVSGMERISRGDLEPSRPVLSRIREIRRLAEAQSHLRDGLEARHRLDQVEHDLSLAREIQQGLLPAQAPEVPGFEITGWNRPADETGGDFYDWLELPDGRVVFTLADVTGHGIGPALIVAVYRAYLRSAASFEQPDLGTILSHVNELLVRDTPRDRFITAVIGILDPKASVVHMLSAGHGPLLLIRGSDGTTERWNADQVPLGIVPGVEFGEARRIELEPGDELVLVTDGFYEWANPEHELFGFDRFEAQAIEHRDAPGGEQVARMVAAVEAHAEGVPQNDDLTALLVRRRP